MKIHEYQGKEIFRQYGVATPRGIACFGVGRRSRRPGSSAARSGW